MDNLFKILHFLKEKILKHVSPTNLLCLTLSVSKSYATAVLREKKTDLNVTFDHNISILQRRDVPTGQLVRRPLIPQSLSSFPLLQRCQCKGK